MIHELQTSKYGPVFMAYSVLLLLGQLSFLFPLLIQSPEVGDFMQHHVYSSDSQISYFETTTLRQHTPGARIHQRKKMWHRYTCVVIKRNSALKSISRVISPLNVVSQGTSAKLNILGLKRPASLVSITSSKEDAQKRHAFALARVFRRKNSSYGGSSTCSELVS